MGVEEDPVGEDGMDIDAHAWPPADVEAADEGVIRKGDPGDFYMKVIAPKFRGVWHYGVITGVVTEWVLEDYGGATQWRAVFEDGDIVDLLRSEVVEAMAAAQEHPPVDADGDARLVTVPEGDDLSRSGKVMVQSGWVMEDCLHHMETCSILTAGPLFEETRVKAIMTEKELASPAVNVVTEEDGPERKAQRGAKARRPGQRGANASGMGGAAVATERYGHRRACVAAGGRRTRDEGVIWKGDPGDFYMKVIAKKFRGVWHYGVITGVVTEWVLEDYGGATQWRAVFEDGDIVDLLRSEVVEAMAAAQEHAPVDADGDARLVHVVLGYVSMVNLFPLAPFHLFFFGLGRDFWRKFVTVQGHIGFRAMKQEDRRQALVLIPSNFGRRLRPSFAVRL
eukprot:jgi/Tetstr1/438411/TSEL_002896.t1